MLGKCHHLRRGGSSNENKKKGIEIQGQERQVMMLQGATGSGRRTFGEGEEANSWKQKPPQTPHPTHTHSGARPPPTSRHKAVQSYPGLFVSISHF